ncbi:thioesterase domain-containing protein [Alkalicoccobacillus plakortidis]|uniref:Uncharacterized protein n=1 Tax=Alkalicoccobacillus plakortidis TaxID=444060 RepID=A0ABT0XN85_9BACI|nr:hypothetical protein [Alkalicoccobacillus plakortidis]MCM2677360.1 hypothetical protein [Alkalicoccobacillus plakortidis]
MTQEGSALASLDRDTINRMRQCYINAVQCLREHKPSIYHGKTVFFRSLQIPDWLSYVGPDIWNPFFTAGVEVYDVDCRHKDMCQPGPLREIAEVVSNKLTGENTI